MSENKNNNCNPTIGLLSIRTLTKGKEGCIAIILQSHNRASQHSDLKGIDTGKNFYYNCNPTIGLLSIRTDTMAQHLYSSCKIAIPQSGFSAFGRYYLGKHYTSYIHCNPTIGLLSIRTSEIGISVIKLVYIAIPQSGFSAFGQKT